MNLRTGVFTGLVYSANCGWISLSNTVAYIQTDSIQQGALAPNGIPVAWLLTNFGTTNVSASADPVHDGISNLQEYLAGTNPNDSNDCFRITSFARNSTHNNVVLQWNARSTRYYAIQKTAALTNAMVDFTNVPTAGWSSQSFSDTNPASFYRVRAYRPLTP